MDGRPVDYICIYIYNIYIYKQGKTIICLHLFLKICVDVCDEVQDANRDQERCSDQAWQDIIRGN